MQGGHGGGITQNKDSQQVGLCGHGRTRTAGLGPCMPGDGVGRVRMGRTRTASRGGSAGETAVAERGQPAMGDHARPAVGGWPRPVKDGRPWGIAHDRSGGGRPRPNEDSRLAEGRAAAKQGQPWPWEITHGWPRGRKAMAGGGGQVVSIRTRPATGGPPWPNEDSRPWGIAGGWGTTHGQLRQDKDSQRITHDRPWPKKNEQPRPACRDLLLHHVFPERANTFKAGKLSELVFLDSKTYFAS